MKTRPTRYGPRKVIAPDRIAPRVAVTERGTDRHGVVVRATAEGWLVRWADGTESELPAARLVTW